MGKVIKRIVTPYVNYIKKCMGERFYNYFFYYYLHLINGVIPKRLSLSNPQTFNEKIIWLKIKHHYSDANILADKCAVRKFVEKKIDIRYLIPLIGIFNNPREIDFTKLPDSFVLKTNHGSGYNIIVKSKTDLNIEKTIKQIEKWLNIDYYQLGKEYQYKGIKPKVICETYLENSPEKPLIDYKIFCFSGEPAFIQVDLDRFTNHKRNFYDLEWKLLPFTTLYPYGKKIIQKPEKLFEMLQIAKTLSEGMIFSRIDLYFYQGMVYFGEITLHHGGGFEPFLPKKYDYIIGEMIHLPI